MKPFAQKTLMLSVLAVIYPQAYAQTAQNTVTPQPVLQIGQVSINQNVNDFKQIGAVASISQEQLNQASELDSVVRALPGTFSHMDSRQGALNVNVRGMTGLGRVNTLIDGVPQTLFGITASSEDGQGFHESEANSTSSFGAAIDPNFLVGGEISRGGVGGSAGVNALVGSANFRTLGVDDVVAHGKTFGVRGKLSQGTNNLGINSMIAVGTKQNGFGAMLALSGKQTGLTYRRGENKAPANTSNQTHKPFSVLGKIEYQNDHQDMSVFARTHQDNIGGRSLRANSIGVNYHYAPEQDLIDINLHASRSQNTQLLNQNAKYATLTNAKSTNQSDYFNLNNTSYFYPAWGQIASTLGASYQINDYKRQAKLTNQADAQSFERTTFSPAGTQKLFSIYNANHLDVGKLGVDANLAYVKGRFMGQKPACDSIDGVAVPCFPQGASKIAKTTKHLNGKLQLSYQVANGFTPFASVAKTSRMPNIQEVFFNNEGGGSMNPFLRPETATTYEAGFNILKHNLFTPNDSLGLKATYFDSKIKDYIHVQSFFLKEDGTTTPSIDDALANGIKAGFNANIAVNSLKPVSQKGIEIGANYDSDKLFGGLSYTKSKSDQPININSGHAAFGFTGGATDRLPEQYWTLTLGTRLLDNKLALSTQIKHYGKSTRLRPDGIDADTSNYHLQNLPKAPLVTDVFAHYQINDTVALRMGVENAFDKLYLHPSHAQNSHANEYSVDDNDNDVFSYTNYAKGRTVNVGVDFKF